MTEQNNRPAAPGPTLEEQLRKAVDDGRLIAPSAKLNNEFEAARTSAFQDAQSLPRRATRTIPELALGYEYSRANAAQSPTSSALPTSKFIAERLAQLTHRLRIVDAHASAIAVTLAGAGPGELQPGKEMPPAATLFVVYERALDEIDRIVDNIESEQARTRNILGD